MGLFDKKNNSVERKELTDLIKTIKNNDRIDSDNKEVIIAQINKLLDCLDKGKEIDYEFETSIIYEYYNFIILNDNIDHHEFIYLNDVKEKIFYLGNKTPNYEVLKELFINKFMGKDGYLYNNVFNLDLFNSFNNKIYFVDIMDIIINDDRLRSGIDFIANYSKTIIRYSSSDEEYRNELISYLFGLAKVYPSDSREYSEKCLRMLKKRLGEYSIDEKEIAKLNDNFEKTEKYINTMKKYETKIEKDKSAIFSMIKKGVKDIEEASELSLAQTTETISRLKQELEVEIAKEKQALRRMDKDAIKRFNDEIEKVKIEVEKKLDEQLVTVEEDLRIKSDSLFNDIFNQYKKQVEEFKSMIRIQSASTTKDLIRIQKTAEESVQKLQETVENEPQLKDFISKVQEESKLRGELIELMQKQQELGIMPTEEKQHNVIIPGSERIIVPASPQIVIPNLEINNKVLDIFNEKISFQARMESILMKKEKLEAEGQIYHEKIDEIIRCIIEGDWVYLWGPSGCGKSYLMNQISELLEIDLVKNGKIGEPYTVMGYYDPQGQFRATQTYIALVYGKLLAYDEFDNGNADTQVAINEIYSKFLDSLEKPDKKHYVTFAEDVPALINPNFRMIAAGNTSGEGENPLYSSRSKIDESVQERMTAKFIKYDNRVEEKIFGNYKEWYKFFCKFREACDNYARQNGQESVPGIATTRDAAAITKYIKNNSKSLSQVVSEKFVQIKSSEYRQELGRFISKEYNIDFSNVKDTANPDELKHANSETIARQFVYQCKYGAK